MATPMVILKGADLVQMDGLRVSQKVRMMVSRLACKKLANQLRCQWVKLKVYQRG